KTPKKRRKSPFVLTENGRLFFDGFHEERPGSSEKPIITKKFVRKAKKAENSTKIQHLAIFPLSFFRKLWYKNKIGELEDQ
ncbi:MAG: hypothetical protein Q4D08_00315, partial [Clostridia bacterium]|nr:hypothetical protein [Clostridia bacterium]